VVHIIQAMEKRQDFTPPPKKDRDSTKSPFEPHFWDTWVQSKTSSLMSLRYILIMPSLLSLVLRDFQIHSTSHTTIRYLWGVSNLVCQSEGRAQISGWVFKVIWEICGSR